ncbi:hypothetical protein OKW21_004955 [Catalinimonas alkaloidigena]|uniref:sulfotransferase domain-containing protein n=1 Tax=Catalinimonas alkaloidigena TaxID=1075417 RepID=UPI002404B704|nr:sulfotransferase domain-containing protein [Catalinimonas alkaloidigena]MDF9799692.1 hypothetical protein [Catalinimonas alkaloidigena]
MHLKKQASIHSRELVLPGMVICGAPKCGTSSLFTWLNDHPELAGANPKETFFLMDQDNPLHNKQLNFHKDGLEKYGNFFLDKTDMQLPFEATTHYMYQETALQVLSAVEPRPKLIFLLRKPSQRILSSFEYSKNNLSAFKKDFSFMDYTDILLSGKVEQLDNYVSRKRSLYVLKKDLYYSTYILFLERWKKAAGIDNIDIYLFEDMVREPGMVLTKIADSLGINANYYRDYDFKRRNRTYTIKHKNIHKALNSFSSFIPAGNLKKVAKKMYFSLQHKNSKPETNVHEALVLLDQYFVPYNDELEKAFNLNLIAWR